MALVPTDGERKRIERAVDAAIRDLGLDLSGIQVLTEAASGPFAVTAIAAALAGADSVVAITRDSAYGAARDVADGIAAWADALGLASRLKFQIGRPVLTQGSIDLVTNLGFVRPIDRSILSRLSQHAAIALMWEPWEARPEDIDIEAAQELSIPIIGTNERHPRIRTFEYLGVLAAKLLFESRCTILGAEIAVLASEPFAYPIVKALAAMGATVRTYEPGREKREIGAWYASLDRAPDAIVVAEHHSRMMLIGEPGGILPRRLAEDGVVITHICGAVDARSIRQSGAEIHPANPAAPGRMTETTGYVGAVPVIDLHLAGLRVGELVVRARRSGLSPREAVASAVASGLAVALAE